MRTELENSALDFQHCTSQLTAAAASAFLQNAWQILGVLLAHGRPARPAELASKCTVLYLTPEFIQFLCSIPNSPLCLNSSHFVTLSRTGFAAIADFVVNSNVTTAGLDNSITEFVPRCLGFEFSRANGIVVTYTRRKRIRLEVDGLPVAKKRAFLEDFDEEKNERPLVGDFNFPKAFVLSSMRSALNSFSLSVQDAQKLEKNLLRTSLPVNSSAGECSYIINMEHDCHGTGTSQNANELGYLQTRPSKYDSLICKRFQHIFMPTVAEQKESSLHHPKLQVLPGIGDINSTSKKSINTTSCSEVDQQMASSQVLNKAFRACDQAIEFTGIVEKQSKVLSDNSDCYCRCDESLPVDMNNTNKSCEGESEETIAGRAKNVVLHKHKLETFSPLPTREQMPIIDSKWLGRISPSPQAAQKHVKYDGVQTIHKNVQSSKLSPQIDQQQYKRNKQVYAKRKLKYYNDQNIDTNKKRQTFTESRNKSASTSVNDLVEQKSFPDFESFVVEEEEGSGGYGRVYRARRKIDNVTFAIKCPHANANRHHVNNELKMLERFGGKNFVIKYEGSFKYKSSDCLVLEHVEHDRPEVLKREIDIFQLQWYGYCMFKALSALHKQGVVHRDVKPGNFLFSRRVNKGYLIDFNLALDLHQKYRISDASNATRNVSFNHIPLPHTKSLPQERARKITNTVVQEAINQDAGKSSKSLSRLGNLKRGTNKSKLLAETSCRSTIKSQGADGSGITSTKDATSTRTPSAERLREPIPMKGRQELISLVHEALQDANHKSVNVHISKRKRVAAPSGKEDKKFLYPTPMPLHATGIAVGGAGLLKSNGDGKHKREGPCVGTKGFRAPEVLFRSLYQGTKVDIWSAGVTLLYLIIGRAPFVGDPDQNIKEIVKLRGSEDLWEVAKLHNQESSLPSDLYDAKYLPSIKLEDWCKQNTRRLDFLKLIPRSLFDLVDKCLSVNPRLRISAEEALRHEFFAPCHEALKKHRLLRQGNSLNSGTSVLDVGESHDCAEVVL